MIGTKVNNNEYLSKTHVLAKQLSGMSSIEEQMIHEVLCKTLALICDLNLTLKNFQAAKTAVKDMEQI